MDIDTPVALPTRLHKRKSTAPHSQTPKKPRAQAYSASSASSSAPASPPAALAASGTSTPRTPSSAAGTRAKKLSCTWPGCAKSFSRPVHLQEHLNAHRGERPHACPHAPCTKAFFRRSHLDHHLKNAHSDVRDYACSHAGCGRAFSTGTRLRRHVASVHDSPEQAKFPCPTCGAEHRKRATLQRHVATAHEGRAAFACEKLAEGRVCGAGFATAGKLRTHEGRAHGVPRYSCTACEGAPAFSTYAAFAAHNRDAHPPACPRCAFVGRSQRDLRRHLAGVHGVVAAAEDLPPPPAQAHVCDAPGCGRSFSKKANLNTHARTTHEGRRFVCGQVEPQDLKRAEGWGGKGACGRAFTSKASLEEHVRTAHMGLPSGRVARRAGERSARVVPAVPDVVDLLTGLAFEQDERRRLACLVPGCAWRFKREYDRLVHARARHGLGEGDISFLVAAEAREREAGGEEAEPDGQEGSQGMEVDGEGEWERFDRQAEHGGEFWLGGGEDDEVDDWDTVQQEMWQLVDDDEDDDDDDDDDDDELIDPMLE